jgi:4-hydroxy-3-methylbut-2-enyl diphosphate reductase
MKILIAENAGFCFGVKRAIDIAKKTLAEDTGEVWLIGEIVHNKIVVIELQQMGLKMANSIAEVPDGSTIIFKAHGSPPEAYTQAETKKLNVIDATCPMVSDIHRKARELEEKRYQVIVFGDKEHEEVVGICGYLKKPVVVRSGADAATIKIKPRSAMVCQSTQKIQDILEALTVLAQRTEELLFINTTCRTTRLRQKEVRELAETADKVLVVGSKNSANTRHLFQEAQKINHATWWIETHDELENITFSDTDTVAVISGASTPESIITEIANKLKKL